VCGDLRSKIDLCGFGLGLCARSIARTFAVGSGERRMRTFVGGGGHVRENVTHFQGLSDAFAMGVFGAFGA